MSIDVNVQNDLVIVTESSEDITVNVSNAAGANGVGVPTGGTTGQVLKKLSNTNYDTYWALDGGGVPYSGATGQVDLGNYDLKVQGLTIGKGNNSLVNNTALGHSTLLTITTGNFNTAVGYESLRNTTTGQYNTAVGQSSLFSNTTGSQNTAIGLNALVYNTTGGSNVVVGLDALQHNTTGSSNTAIGYNAGSHITGGSTPNTTATNSVFIGRDSKAGADGQTNQIVIGQNAVGNGSNTATFGNTATTANYFTGSINGGSFVKSGGTSSQILAADGSVLTAGTNITISSGTISASGGITGSGATGQVAYWNGTSSQTGSAGLTYVDSTGVMTLSKNQNASTRINVSNTTNGSSAGSGITFTNNVGVNFGSIFLSSSSSTPYKAIGAGDLQFYKTGTGDITFQHDVGGGKMKFAMGGASTAQMTLTSAGRLLLGTTTEGTNLLDVNGGVNIVGGLIVDTNTLSVDAANNRVGVGTASPNAQLNINQLSGTTKGLFISGDEVYVSGNGSTTEGVRIALGVSRASNRQLWMGDNSAFGSSTLSLFRYQTGIAGFAALDAVTGDGITRLTTILGSNNSVVGVGYNDGVALNIAGYTAKLNVFSSGTETTTNLLIKKNNTAAGLYVDVQDTAGASKLVLTSAGRLLLGTTTESTYLLDVNGTARVSGDTSIDGVLRETVTTNRQTASYSLVLTDRGKLVEMNVATANNLTVPLNSSVAFPIGTKIDIAQYGAGQTTVVATSGVTVRSAGGALKLAAQYSGATLVKIATDEWYLFGDIIV